MIACAKELWGEMIEVVGKDIMRADQRDLVEGAVGTARTILGLKSFW